MKESVSITLAGDEPGLAAVLEEYAANAIPPLQFGKEAEADITLVYARDAKALDAHVKQLRASKNEATQKARLLVLETTLEEPAEELHELGLAGIFRKPLRLAALLDAGFTALRLAALKSPRKLSNSVVFNPFTRMLEDQEKGKSEVLTPKEADLLLALLEAGPAGLTREAALTRIWHYHREADTHAVETAAWRLRRKLESLFQPQVLESRDGAYFLRISGLEARD